MSDSLKSLVDCGTKLYLDSVHPQEIQQNLRWGATGATSNPAIISDIIKSGAYDDRIRHLIDAGLTDDVIAWTLTDELVSSAEKEFLAIWQRTGGNEGWVSFELDPLLEDPALGLTDAERSSRYVDLGKSWSVNHPNRMIKVPATRGGIGALESLAAAGVTLNVTLIFTAQQYRDARDAIARGFAKRTDRARCKSVYSVFISRIDVYADQYLPFLSAEAQGEVGLLNAKRIWVENTGYWQDQGLPLAQEIIFASTGTKKPEDKPWKYVAALAGSDIQTNPPETNRATATSGLTFTRRVDEMPSAAVQKEIDTALDVDHMHHVLMEEGIAKFVKPQRNLLALIAKFRT